MTDTTLRTLGERLSAGEAADLALYLPDGLAEAILADDESATEREIDAARKQLPDPFGVIFEPPDETNGGP